MCEIVSETSEELRRSMYLDVVEQLDAIRVAVGLPTEICFECGEDGLYDCMGCGMDFCGGCGEREEDGFLCHDCYKVRAAKGNVIGVSQV